MIALSKLISVSCTLEVVPLPPHSDVASESAVTAASLERLSPVTPAKLSALSFPAVNGSPLNEPILLVVPLLNWLKVELRWNLVAASVLILYLLMSALGPAVSPPAI